MQILCGLQVVFFLFNCQTPAKVKDASDLMTNAPDVVDPVQLEELGIAVVKTEEETTEEA